VHVHHRLGARPRAHGEEGDEGRRASAVFQVLDAEVSVLLLHGGASSGYGRPGGRASAVTASRKGCPCRALTVPHRRPGGQENLAHSPHRYRRAALQPEEADISALLSIFTPAAPAAASASPHTLSSAPRSGGRSADAPGRRWRSAPGARS